MSKNDMNNAPDEEFVSETDRALKRIIDRGKQAAFTVHRDFDTDSSDIGSRGSDFYTDAEALDHEDQELSDDLEALRIERENRAALKRVAGLSTELEDVTEVEYRQLRLENVVLIGVYSQGTLRDAENSLRELGALAQTAGARVLDGLLQRRPYPDPATYFGKGKALELKNLVASLGADTVIADIELQPSQRRALEDVVGVKVIDRTAVILDIFSQHAKSSEGKAQVELAQLEYLLPRLRGWGESMSRQAGGQVASGGAGMGSRGPGETKMELDRRKIHQRMAKLRKDIKAMEPARQTKRAKRRRGKVPSVAIVGYTNAGKSSLLNALTGSSALVQNQLFATLDTTVRSSVTADGREFTFSDTVGFVRNLPHQLVEAFQSTFEEVAESDVILHVVDGSHPDPAAQIETVRDVVAEVEAAHIPEIVVFNKADLLSEEQRLVLHGLVPSAVFVSTVNGEGLEELKIRVASTLPQLPLEVLALIPFSEGHLISELHEKNIILATTYEEEGTLVHAYVGEGTAAKLGPYIRTSVTRKLSQ